MCSVYSSNTEGSRKARVEMAGGCKERFTIAETEEMEAKGK
jgi:hypothetical protein